MTKDFKHGLVVGKFYPPHYGHMHLIRTAAKRADTVTVLVMGSKYDRLSLGARAHYIAQHMGKEGHHNVEIIWQTNEIPMNLGSDATWTAQVEIMKRAIEDRPIDSVFASEDYVHELAGFLNAAPVLVDLERIVVPISGTEVRGDLADKWGFLPSEVRADLTVKAVFVGAESTGTTTISQRVWKHYHDFGGAWARGQWIPEYGREYTIDKLDATRAYIPEAEMEDLTWSNNDFVEIAKGQNDLETQALSQGSPVLVCDTDSLATILWERRYMGEATVATSSIASEARPADIYFITDHEGVPFVQDGIRDGEHLRADMTEWFKDFLTENGYDWVFLTGSIAERTQLAIDVIDHVIDEKQSFNDPI